MSDSGETRNPYDEVPYKSLPFPQSQPDRLATLAALFGLKPPPVEQARILELGCSSGGNLIPLAERYPRSQCVGVDFSRVEVAAAEATVQALSLENIRFECRDIADIAPDLGTFDYIIAHGVYSWVSDALQDRLLAVCAEHLAPDGLAYVSYNTYPGWHMRGMTRDMMLYRTRSIRAPREKLRHARELLDFLAQSVPVKDSAYGRLLADELEQMRNKEDYYLLHDYLEDVNLPIYFHEFVERAERSGLQYVGEADFHVMATSNFRPEVEKTLQTVSSDRIEVEQYMDFLRNRTFRQTILCHRGLKVDCVPDPIRLEGLHVATSSQPDVNDPDIRSKAPLNFRRPGSTMTTADPLVKAAMLHLAKLWPQPLAFSELLPLARSQVNPQAVVVDSARAAADARRLADALLRCYATGHVDLGRTAASFTTTIGRRPAASRLARLQAATESHVTNLKHERAALNDLERQVVRILDGQSDLVQLIERLLAEVKSGRVVVHDAGRTVADEERLRQIISDALDQCVKSLAHKAFLQPYSSQGDFHGASAEEQRKAVPQVPAATIDWRALSGDSGAP